jgi:signal transduction histidine kinase
MFVLAGIPIAFAATLLLGGLGRTSEVWELGAWLGAGPTSRADLAQALRRALGDPSAQVWFWVRGGYVDADGRPIAAAVAQPDRGLVEIELDGHKIGAIQYDASLLTDRGPVETAGRVIALAADRERITTELLALQASLQNTLGRVVESGDLERRRIARDLHDGLQSRLVLLGMSAFQIGRDPTASRTVSQAVDELQRGLTSSVEELRRLVAGVMPAVLLERGLYVAAQEFLDGVPIPTRLTLVGEGEPLPPSVESAAYFLMTEAVTNALKHARATELVVSIERTGDRLLIEVADDGVGGAHGGVHGGLTGLADRVGAVGGRFDVVSPPGQGTRLTAELPCGSPGQTLDQDMAVTSAT